MRIVVLLSLLLAVNLQATEPMCGTSPENDLRIRAARERVRERVRTHATPAATVRDGAFYIQNDESITPGYRPFDLEGQSLVFTPAAGGYAMRREPLRYVEPAGAMVRDFQNTSGFVFDRDLPFAFPFLGRNVTRIYITMFNGIAFDQPIGETATQFDAIEASVHRQPILSPLMTTARKPRQLESPKVWVDTLADRVRVTWRSTGNEPFGYDLQAELHQDGTIVYSYRSLTEMRWGTPVILPGFDPATVVRAPIVGIEDSLNDVIGTVPAAVKGMLNIRRVEIQRLRDSDLFAIRILLVEPIDRTKIAAGEAIAFQATIGLETAAVEIERDRTTVASFTGWTYEPNGASAHVNGDVVEIYGIQPTPDVKTERSLLVRTIYRPQNRVTDTSVIGIPLAPAPRVLSTDLSAVPETATLPLPIAETFTLGVFDPFQVWEVMRTSHYLSDYDYDAVAMYQTFYTDMIFYAGAYATGGNPQVDGVASYSPYYGQHVGRAPTLLHMNQLTYNYSAAEDTGSKVLLHEFGHRWLYFFSIRENGQTGRFLNPISAHPAAYVHTPSAFPVYGEQESSVMGGAYFTPLGDGTFKAHVANFGYSWTDLYLMGLAAVEEVPPWFYIANTDLPKAYWPVQGAIAKGDRRNVAIGQVTTVHGPRIPSASLAQHRFRILFVLVTEDAEPTEAEVAKMNAWRTIMQRNFSLATGGRGRLETAYVKASKRRATR
jgi:hypothetical protein